MRQLASDDPERLVQVLSEELRALLIKTLAEELADRCSQAKTIDRFCEAKDFGSNTYYAMQERGVGPKEIRFGNIVRITPRAERAWDHMMENPTPEQAAAIEASRVKLRQRARRAANAAVASSRHVSNGRRSR